MSVLIAAAAPIGEVGACIATVGDAATTADYITIFQATPDVTNEIATAAVTNGCPPLDRDTMLDTGGSPGA